MSGNNIPGVVGVNTLFQDPNGLNGFNENGIPVRTILVNNAVQTPFDPALISRSQAANDSSASFQIIGIDAELNRTGRLNFGFNYFRIGQQVSGGLSTSNQRRAMVIDGTTGVLLANIQPGSSSAVAENQLLIDAINSVSAGQAVENFTLWAEANIGNADDRGEDDDADLDGMSNLLEYAYGTDPSTADSEKGPRLVREGGVLELRYQRSTTAHVAPLVIIGGESPDSATPQDFSGVEEVESAAEGVEEVTISLTENSIERLFLRLRTHSL